MPVILNLPLTAGGPVKFAGCARSAESMGASSTSSLATPVPAAVLVALLPDALAGNLVGEGTLLFAARRVGEGTLLPDSLLLGLVGDAVLAVPAVAAGCAAAVGDAWPPPVLAAAAADCAAAVEDVRPSPVLVPPT